MDDGDHAWVMATYQQLLTVGWVPKQLLQKAVFNTFIFEGGDQKFLSRKIPTFLYTFSYKHTNAI